MKTSLISTLLSLSNCFLLVSYLFSLVNIINDWRESSIKNAEKKNRTGNLVPQEHQGQRHFNISSKNCIMLISILPLWPDNLNIIS